MSNYIVLSDHGKNAQQDGMAKDLYEIEEARAKAASQRKRRGHIIIKSKEEIAMRNPQRYATPQTGNKIEIGNTTSAAA
ncbi:hypothetical protein N7508_005506 [Penicillium antarcticum]|uniref:uncharacterized protein n=1 Tax=Penicillium antarcticum TaxID=416450 RepID=UPI00239C5C9E|nr:uncharacterized protein N7508_005506 [Penicillium antarcticum]KAJ5306491.1 hypothetical protein N7508_005506 [Penicillium antarcticum]